MPAPRKYSQELRDRSLRLVSAAMAEDPSLSLNQAVKRIGERVGVVPDTLRGWTKQSQIDAGGAGPSALTVKTLESIRAAAGLLLVVFVGAVNTLGLKSAELDDVLRNQSYQPTVVFAIMIAAVLFAILSIFLNREGRVHLGMVVAAVLGLLSLAIATVFLVATTRRNTATGAGLGVGASASIGLAVIALGILISGKRSVFALEVPFGAGTLALLVGITLAGTATYAAVRLQAREQGVPAGPLISADLTETASNAVLSLTVDGSRLIDQSALTLDICATLRSGPASADPGSPNGCSPCLVTPSPASAQCLIFRGIFRVDENGRIHRTVVLPVSTVEYQHLTIYGADCSSLKPKSVCPKELDLDIPSYQTTAQTTALFGTPTPSPTTPSTATRRAGGPLA